MESVRKGITISKTIREIFKFVENDVFYSFKYEYEEKKTNDKLTSSLKDAVGISVIVIYTVENEAKKIYFHFKPDLSSPKSHGELIFTDSINRRLSFKTINDSAIYTSIINTVHVECNKIVLKFKDSSNVSYSEPETFFEN